MENIYELKAKNANEAIEIARKEYNLDSEFKVEVQEIKENKNILGFINFKGTYKVIAINLKSRIEDTLKKLLELMHLNLNYTISKIKDRNYLVDLSGEDNGIIIGKRGKTLYSFEHLLNCVLKEVKIEVDVEKFKEKRELNLRELAKKTADRVIKSGKQVTLNSMPPKERKIIHSSLNEFPEIETSSEGKDPNRYVVVRLKRTEN